jgi:hypothetical protein
MKIIKILPLFIFAIILTGCGNGSKEEHPQERTRDVNSELIREEGTNVAALDENNDGMVYQCPMDYQVISDDFASCPVCKMDLEEYSIADAQKNLENHFHQ